MIFLFLAVTYSSKTYCLDEWPYFKLPNLIVSYFSLFLNRLLFELEQGVTSV